MSDPNARDLRGELEDFTGEYPRSWIAKVGDVVVGRVERYSEGSTPYGRCPIVVVADEITGELMSIWLMHTVLRNEFSEQKPKPGERVGIKRLPDSERGYKKFALRVDRGPTADVPDFSQYGAPADVLEAPATGLRPTRSETPPPADDGSIPF
jgi:hypothetical protein